MERTKDAKHSSLRRFSLPLILYSVNRLRSVENPNKRLGTKQLWHLAHVTTFEELELFLVGQ